MVELKHQNSLTTEFLQGMIDEHVIEVTLSAASIAGANCKAQLSRLDRLLAMESKAFCVRWRIRLLQQRCLARARVYQQIEKQYLNRFMSFTGRF